MFETPDHPKSLDEELFDSWFEKGRDSKISYSYLLIIWDEFEENYFPVYLEEREEIAAYQSSELVYVRQKLVAAYDLFSETRVV